MPRPVLASLLSVALLLVSAAASPLDQWGTRSLLAQGTATIGATPNPVPPGAGPGVTTITWTTAGGRGSVYLSVDDGPEQIFAGEATGSRQISWISAGPTYAFRLYRGTDRSVLLASVE